MKRTSSFVAQQPKRKRVTVSRMKVDRGPTASQIAAAKIAAMRSEELKFLDTAINQTIANTMVQNNLNVVSQDDTEDGRTGRRITVRSVDIKGCVSITGAVAAANARDWVKLMLVLDTQANKAAAITSTDLFVSDAIESYNNLANKNRFRVLWTDEFTLAIGGAAASGAAFVFGSDSHYFRCHKKVEIPIDFDNTATSGARTTQTQNSLSFVAISENGVSAINAGAARIRFTDA